MEKSALEGKVAAELHQIASDLGIEGHRGLKKADLIERILAHANGQNPSAGSAAATGPSPAGTPSGASPPPADQQSAGSEGGTGETRTDVRRENAPAPSGNGGVRQDDRVRERPREQRFERGGGERPPYRDGQGPRRRPSREERRRAREERRQREVETREEELATAPTATGLLDILPEGYGFLRTTGFLPGQQDIYVSLSQVRRFMLRKVDTVNGVDPETAKSRPNFDKLTPLFPHDRFRLETGPTDVTGRIIDMITPIGKGQRGMVVSPPKAGKTTVLKNIANGIINSSPDTHVIILLVDERPEEVTDWQRTVQPAEVVYSTFDKPPDQHIQVTELVLERAKRLAEMGKDVAIILDSITRLARAYNLAAPASGKILSGGIDSTALYPPRRFFGPARNIE